MKKNFFLFLIFVLSSIIYAQMRATSSGHNGEIEVLLEQQNAKEESFFAFGKDGFVTLWNSFGQGKKYQLTDKEIKFAAANPIKNEIAIYETDSNTIHSISVWDMNKMIQKFTLSFQDSILSLTYSKNGTYLIAGTSTEKGTVFINTTNGKFENPIKDKMNVMSFIETTNSEKTMMTYSLTGNICYYSFQDKTLKTKISTEIGITSPIVFGQYKFLAGIKNGDIVIFDAQTGKRLMSHSANFPIIFVKNDEFYYYEQNSTKIGTLNKIIVEENNVLKITEIERFNFDINETVNKVLLQTTRVIFATTQGNLYCAEFVENGIRNLLALTENKYQKIKSVAVIDDNLYILTDKAIYLKNEINSETTLTELIKTQDFNNMISHNGNLILWSTEKSIPVYLFDLDSRKLDKLFSTQGQLITVKSCAGQLIEIESRTTVKRFNFETRTLQEIYYGSGVQDAIMLNSEELYIAKSVTNSIDSSLIFVNTRTQETVPIKLEIDYIYAVTNDEYELKESDKKNIYAIGITHNSKTSNTVLIKYNIEKKSMETLYNFNQLNMNAFEIAYNQNIFTNVIDFAISSVNGKNKKLTIYDRSVSLAKNVALFNNSVILLNYDGSISWISGDKTSINFDWYITNDNILIEIK